MTDRVEKDEISVGADEGRFDALRLGAKRIRVTVRKVVIHFGNDEKQTIERNFVVPRSARGPVLDLEGRDRVVRKVNFTYKASSGGRRGAVIELWGRP